MINYNCPFYNHLKTYGEFTDPEIETLLPMFTTKKLRKYQYLLQEGEICRRDFFVLRGMLRKYSVDATKEWISQFAYEGQWISDHDSQLNGSPSAYYIDALEETEVLSIEVSAISSLIATSPKFERYYRNEIRRALIAQEKRVQCMQRMAANCYEDFLSEFPFLQQRISQAQIASFMGITRESLSRLKNQAWKSQRNKVRRSG